MDVSRKITWTFRNTTALHNEDLTHLPIILYLNNTLIESDRRGNTPVLAALSNFATDNLKNCDTIFALFTYSLIRNFWECKNTFATNIDGEIFVGNEIDGGRWFDRNDAASEYRTYISVHAFYHESESAKDPIKKRLKDRKIKKEEPWYTHLKNCRFISRSLSYRA